MIDRKEIELLIRAQLDGGKDLESVTKSIGKLEAAIDKQSAAAKKGEASIDELKGSLEALKSVQTQLGSNANLIGNFQRLADQISKTEERVTRTAKAYGEYEAKLKSASEVTDKQQDRLIKLSTAADRAKASLDKQLATQQKLTDALQEAGIATSDLAASEEKIRRAAADLGVIYNKNQKALASYATDVRAARDAEKALAEERAFEKKLQDASNLVKATNYVRFWTDALEEAEKQQAQIAADNSLRKTADDAEKAAKGYNTLARAAETLKPAQASLRDTINDIIDPSRKAVSSLDGLEKQITDLSKAASAVDSPLRDYRDTLNGLSTAQKELARQAGLIDAFTRQTAALRAARTEFTSARAQVAEYAAEVRKGGEAGAQFTKALSEAQARAKAAAQALSQQVSATREAKAALTAAGIATSDLAGAQARLTTAAKSATGAVQQVSTAIKTVSTSTDKATASTEKSYLFGKGGRTTLDLMQRIRGEILSLTAAYVGLFGVIRLGQGSVQAFSDRETIKNQLGIGLGNDKAKIDAEYAYVKAQSDRIGLEFDRTAKGYAKFAASAALAGRSQQEIRYVFETFSEVSKVANISADDLDGVFKALEQIYSKGKIQAEELRGQLGDRLFGAFEIAAKALKDQFPDLSKALEGGQVSASQLVKIAEQYRKTVAEQLPAATNGLTASQARLNNALLDFKLVIADSGFIDSYTKALKEITLFLQSDDGKKFAKEIGGVFKDAAEGAILLAKNFGTVIDAIKAFGIAWAAIKVITAATRIPTLIDDVKRLGTTIGKSSDDVAKFAARFGILGTVVGGVLSVIGAAALGWNLGKILWENFETVRVAGVQMAAALRAAWIGIKGGFEIAMAAIPAIAKNALAAVLNQMTFFVRKGLSIFASFASALGMDGLAASIEGLSKALEVEYADIGAATATARANLQKEMDALRDMRDDALARERGVKGNQGTQASVRRIDNALDGPGGATTAFPGVAGGGKLPPSEAEINKRQNQIEALRKSLETLESKIDRAQNESLKSQLDATDKQYAELERDIRKLGGTEGAEMLKKYNELMVELRNTTITKFNQKLLEEEKSIRNKVEDLQAQGDKKYANDLERRKAAIVLQYQDLYRELDELKAKFELNGRDTTELTAARGRIDAGVKALQQLEEQKYAKEQLNEREARTNELIKLRDAQIEAINAKQEAGRLTDEQATAERQAAMDALNPKIVAAAEATKEWAIANAAIFSSPEDKEIFLAQMDALIVKTQSAKKQYTDYETAINKGAAGVISNSLDSIADHFGKIITGQQSVSQGFKGMLQAFGQFVAAFLRDIALMIIKQQIFNALAGMGGFLGGVGAAGGGVPISGTPIIPSTVAHSGGVIGSVMNRSRNVPSTWFANAPKYHTGGVVGLAPDEYPAILQAGEEVLSKGSPRNILNGGGLTGGAAPSAGTRIVLVDDRAKVPEAMSSAEGEQVIVQAIRRNLPTIKQMIGG